VAAANARMAAANARMAAAEERMTGRGRDGLDAAMADRAAAAKDLAAAEADLAEVERDSAATKSYDDAAPKLDYGNICCYGHFFTNKNGVITPKNVGFVITHLNHSYRIMFGDKNAFAQLNNSRLRNHVKARVDEAMAQVDVKEKKELQDIFQAKRDEDYRKIEENEKQRKINPSIEEFVPDDDRLFMDKKRKQRAEEFEKRRREKRATVLQEHNVTEYELDTLDDLLDNPGKFFDLEKAWEETKDRNKVGWRDLQDADYANSVFDKKEYEELKRFQSAFLDRRRKETLAVFKTKQIELERVLRETAWYAIRTRETIRLDDSKVHGTGIIDFAIDSAKKYHTQVDDAIRPNLREDVNNWVKKYEMWTKEKTRWALSPFATMKIDGPHEFKTRVKRHEQEMKREMKRAIEEKMWYILHEQELQGDIKEIRPEAAKFRWSLVRRMVMRIRRNNLPGAKQYIVMMSEQQKRLLASNAVAITLYALENYWLPTIQNRHTETRNPGFIHQARQRIKADWVNKIQNIEMEYEEKIQWLDLMEQLIELVTTERKTFWDKYVLLDEPTKQTKWYNAEPWAWYYMQQTYKWNQVVFEENMFPPEDSKIRIEMKDNDARESSMTFINNKKNDEYEILLIQNGIDRTDAGALQRVLAALKPLVNIMIGTKAVPLPYQPINSGVFLRKETYEMATKEAVVEELTTKL
jgi:hypothetical protein